MTERELYQKAFSPVHAPSDTVTEVLIMANKPKHISKTGRVVLIAAVCAALLIGSALAVSALRSDAGLLARLRLTDADVAALENASISALSEPVASDTHEGITVSVARAAADGQSAAIALRVEGLDIPEGYIPFAGRLTIMADGEELGNYGWGFDNGLRWRDGKAVYDDGTAAQPDGKSFVARYDRGDGSLELDIDLSPDGSHSESLVGQEIELCLNELGIINGTQSGTEPEQTVAGPWMLRWTLAGAGESLFYTLNEPLNDWVTLSELTLSPMSVKLAYNGDGKDGETLELLPELVGLQKADGSVLTVLGGGYAGCEDDGATFTVEKSISGILDPQEITALIFRDGIDGAETVVSLKN